MLRVQGQHARVVVRRGLEVVLEMVETARNEEGGGGVGKRGRCLRSQQRERHFLLRGEATRELKCGGPQDGRKRLGNDSTILRLQRRFENARRFGFVCVSFQPSSLTALVILQQGLLEAVKPPARGAVVQTVQHRRRNANLR